MTEIRRYAVQGTFTVALEGVPVVKGVKTAVTLPFVALNSFDAMQVGVMKIQEAHGELGALSRVDLIDLGVVAGGGSNGHSTTENERPASGGAPVAAGDRAGDQRTEK